MQKRRKTFVLLPKINYFCIAMYKQLTSEQRYTISVLLEKKMTISFIAETIGKSVSTVFHEIKRNCNEQGVYNGRVAVLKSRRRNPGLQVTVPSAPMSAVGCLS